MFPMPTFTIEPQNGHSVLLSVNIIFVLSSLSLSLSLSHTQSVEIGVKYTVAHKKTRFPLIRFPYQQPQ